MPLLHRRPFTRLRPPVDLRPEEEVFLCKITHEVFRTYDEFFERTILCNSLVWSCALTGRAGLTYLEAVESERRAQHSLQNFPQALVVPLLHLVAVSRRCRLTELCEDVHAFVKERFFPGEVVDVTDRHGNSHVCEVLEVQSPHTSCNAATINKQPTGGDTIVISDSDEESPCPPKPPHPPLNGKRKKSMSPSVFRYTVRKIPEGTMMTIKAVHISRRKNTLSKEKLKLLFKQHCEPQNGTIMLKASTVAQYKLGEHSFSQFFPDEPLKFPFSPPSKAGAGNHGNGLPGQLATQEKLKLLQEKEQMRATSHEKSRLKKEKEEEQMKTIQERIQLKKEKEEEQESKRREREELRRRFEEDKLKRKEEKDKERIKLKEDKKKYAERLKLWNKPREDLECEDLKELPCPVPVQTRVPADLFGDVLMVLEFLAAFGEHFDLKDEFPDGVTLEVLEEALCGSDPEGPLCELLFFFLSAVFQILEPQEDPDLEPDQEMSEVLEDDADPTESAVNAVASLAASWPLLHQGCGIKQLDLDSCTLSEILRLHILASGADCNHGNAKFRYQKQGGFLSSDDPCVELRLANPGLMKRLATTPVYDLSPGDKLCILQALLCKLLTLVESRELMEACGEELRAARHELRDLRCEQHRREREEAAHRVRLKKEERLREQEEKIKEEERNGVDQRSLEVVAEEEKKLSNVVRATETSSPSPLPFSTLSQEELEREAEKVRVLQAHVQQVASCTSLVPLGRDRLYRRYWLLPSSPALFVEDDCFGLTEDMLVPRPAPPRVEREGGEDEEAEEEEEAGSSGHGSVSPSPPSGPPATWPNRWAFYGSVEEVERLLEALNPRGHREGGLREALLQEKDRLRLQLDATSHRFSQPAETVSSTPSAEVQMESRLRDLLLDLEERLYQGILGNIKVMGRVRWREALQSGQYDLICDEQVNGGLQPSLARLEELRGAEPGSATPTAVSCTVRCLARALVHVEQGIERKFLKPPLGEEEPRKDQKLKKKKLDDESSEDGSETSRVCKTVLERWRESLHTSSSLSQVFVHLATLDRSVLWSRSLLNTRCKVCRRKGDADSMVLCDSCHRGNHTHCLRPKLKAVPEGDWFCPDCRPKQRSSRPAPRPSPPSQGRAEEDRSRQAPRSSVSKATSRPTQGLPVATPKSSSTTNGKKSSSRSSGSASLPPPRSGTRTSARLSHEIEVPPAAQGGALNRSQTECSPPVKPSRPVLTPSSSSSSRRSSGRNHGVHQLSACEQLAVDLVRHPDSWPFKKLVSRTQVPDYYDIIKTPIALSTIRERINSCDYQTSAGFIADVELMFSNCMQYNPRHTNEAKAGLRLQAFFQAELSRLGLTPPASPLASPPTKRSRL